MIILGLDPGTRALGYGVLDTARAPGSAPGTCRHVESGTLVARGRDLVHRLVTMAEAVDALTARLQPEEVAIEAIFFAKNAHSALTLGYVRGALLVGLARRGLWAHSYSASTIKQAATGSGRATKEQVQGMVCRLLRLTSVPATLDASDALAVAFCHAQVAASPLLQRRAAAPHDAARLPG